MSGGRGGTKEGSMKVRQGFWRLKVQEESWEEMFWNRSRQCKMINPQLDAKVDVCWYQMVNISQEGMETVCRGREMKQKVCEDVFDVQMDGR